MIRLNAATVLLQWAVGGLAFGWLTPRRRELGIGYGCLFRGVYLVLAVGAFAAGRATGPDTVRDVCSLLVAAAAGAALVVSVARRKAGVAGQREREERRSARVAAMTGIDRPELSFDRSLPEFPPVLDIIAPVIGLVGLV